LLICELLSDYLNVCHQYLQTLQTDGRHDSASSATHVELLHAVKLIAQCPRIFEMHHARCTPVYQSINHFISGTRSYMR